MLLLVAIFIGIAASIVRARILHRPLNPLHIKTEWMVFLAVIPQVFVFHLPFTNKLIPEELIPVIQISSQALLLIFVALNIKQKGMWLLGAGLLLNFLVITMNGGWMPISIETLQRQHPTIPIETWQAGARLGLTKDRILLQADTKLWWLSDIFILPKWIEYKVAYSLGDVILSLGAFFLLWDLSSIKQKE